MPLHISQETFNDAVQENITNFGMTPTEARTDAINQFKAQGVDLSNINTDYELPENLDELLKITNKLTELQDKPISEELIETLSLLKTHCDKGISIRIYLAKNGAYESLLAILKKSDLNKSTQLAALKAMVSLVTKQPDYLSEDAMHLILANLEPQVDMEIQKQTLKWAKECCIKHEINRQKLFELNIVDKLTEILKEGQTDNLKEVLSVIRALILDDDIRVEFGKAHEHAKVIAAQGLTPIIDLLRNYKTNDAIVIDTMLTISALLVRTEFCKLIDEAGGLDLIKEIMLTFIPNEKVNRQCFKLLKALAGNDNCKSAIILKGFAPIITTSLDTHKGDAATATAGLQCVSALTLRSPENSKALFEASFPDVIIEIMKLYPDDKLVQRAASWAIRNMVSRSRYQNKHFIKLGVEELLHTSLSKFKEFEYDIKAALRDLECEVNLKEEWTGKGGAITTGAVKNE